VAKPGCALPVEPLPVPRILAELAAIVNVGGANP
jgi:hypothetical protein